MNVKLPIVMHDFTLLYILINLNKNAICLQIKQPVTYVWNQIGQQFFKYVTLYDRGMFSKCIISYCPNNYSCSSN
jgi:hypothetical protein